jgi:hypothetical protein
LPPAPCFRAFRRVTTTPIACVLERAAVDADRLAGYGEGHMQGLPADFAALRVKVDELHTRVSNAACDTDVDLAPALAVARQCTALAQEVWIAGIAEQGKKLRDAARPVSGLHELTAALGKLHVLLDEVSAAAGAR